MKHKPKDIQYCERLFQSFYEIGSTPQGGVTRLGYTETEDAMHEVFKGLGRELGGSIHTDEVGNTYVANTDEMGYTLIGSHLDSVIDGGRSRLRPIIMTALTTILGMVPMAVSQGEGAEMWRPMGIAVIGGLTFSTLLTLLFVPTLYCIFAYNGVKRQRKKLHKAAE